LPWQLDVSDGARSSFNNTSSLFYEVNVKSEMYSAKAS
jgi:hypothetical protein